MFAQPSGPCVKAAEGTAQAAAALTRGQVGLHSHHPGQVGLEAVSHAEAMFDDRRDLRLRRRDGLLRLHRRAHGRSRKIRHALNDEASFPAQRDGETWSCFVSN
jgi:hypothetical protein